MGRKSRAGLIEEFSHHTGLADSSRGCKKDAVRLQGFPSVLYQFFTIEEVAANYNASNSNVHHLLHIVLVM